MQLPNVLEVMLSRNPVQLLWPEPLSLSSGPAVGRGSVQALGGEHLHPSVGVMVEL